ncbi:MAG: lipoyl(octanoyl) transferase LipB [Anaerolineae bacterium]|nr:lipoyl(octanoyl) transferase LipB [Gemmatimonadaceae bacterium]
MPDAESGVAGGEPASFGSEQPDSRGADSFTPNPSTPVPELWIVRLGTVPYYEVLELQRSVAKARITGEVSHDVLLLVEHPPVVTLGRKSKRANLISSAEVLRAEGVELFEVERGGDVTFHGPGQLVGYPIVDLKRHKLDLHWYLRCVEDALVRVLEDFGIAGQRSAGYTGVWTRASSEGNEVALRKIASIGVHARDWVTWHGFALNVTTDLSYFDLIVPCGIQDVEMTSIARELGRKVGMAAVEDAVSRAFCEVFSLLPRSVDSSALAVYASTS